MGTFGLDTWNVVKKKRDWTSLLLGNGASIAVSDGFRYSSLFQVAPLNSSDRDVFAALETSNFEEVLNHLRISELICTQLNHASGDVATRHKSIRRALIDAVDDHHVSWLDVNQADRLETISAALRQYAAVFTTNYDLLVYWAMMIDGAGTGFGDLFWNSSHTFDPFDTEVRDDKTIVYWLHGGLHLFTNTWGQAVKRAGGALNLLEAFASAPEPPLFISEGTWRRKRRAIRRSQYLEHAYAALAGGEDDIVVLGQSLSVQDSHIVQAIRRDPSRRLAFGIYPASQTKVNRQRAEISDLLNGSRVWFFDSTTHPLGDPALKI